MFSAPSMARTSIVWSPLARLEKIDARLSDVVECRFFGGLTEEEAAVTLGVSLRTVQRDWKLARAWLQEELEGAG